MTHRFTNCTFDLRGVDYACVSRGDEFEIGHIGEGDRVLIDGDTLDFTGLHILGPVALAERIKVAVELECQFLTTERGSLRTEIETLRDELAAEKAKSARLVDAAVYLRDDMLVRAECGIDIIHGEQYRIVNAGNGAWVGFIDAIAAYEVKT